MSNLRSKLIRLAHANPELRAQILPLLKDAGCEKLPEGGMRDNCEEKVEEGKESASKKAAGHTTYSEYVRDWKKLKYPVTVKGEILTEERWTKLMKGEESASKKAGSNDVIEYVLPMDDMAKLYHKLEKEGDEQSAKLLMEVYNVLRARLKLSSGEGEAMNRIRGVVLRADNWPVDLLRNNIFKAAHSLGMKLPSMMF